MLLTVGVLLLAAVLILAGYMIFVEPRRFRVRRVHIPVSRRERTDVAIQNPDFPPVRILHITDTHFCGRDEAKLRFLGRVAREHYDLVLFTGDLIDRPAGLESCVEAARLFSASHNAGASPRPPASPQLSGQERKGPAGVFAVLGGHDYYWPSLLKRYWEMVTTRRMGFPPARPNSGEALVSHLAEAGVTVLHDENRIVRLSSGQLAVVGLRDSFCFDPDYEAAWSGLPPGTPVIVIAHSPDVLPEVVRRGADLAFFGHTHGGQVRLPFVGALVTRSSLPPRRARGVFRDGDTVFALNNGMGAGVGIGYRLLCPPEVSVVTVEPESKLTADDVR